MLSLNTAVLASAMYGTDDGITILNSILGAYGLPEFKQNTTFRDYDDFDNEYVFSYPRQWVSRPNTLRPGVYLSNFKTADKVSVEVFPVPNGDDFVYELVASVLSPGQEIGGNSRLELPPRDRVRSETLTIDGVDYTYLAFTSQTTTRSGYDIRRKNFAVAAVRRGDVYCVSASARSDQYNKEKEALLVQIVQSFRLR